MMGIDWDYEDAGSSADLLGSRLAFLELLLSAALGCPILSIVTPKECSSSLSI